MNRAGSLLALFVAGACGGKPPAAAAPTPAPAPTAAAETETAAAAAAAAAREPEAAPSEPAPPTIPGVELNVGDVIVIVGNGVYTYEGIVEQGGKALARFKGDEHSMLFELDKVAGAIRRLISKEEAERRLAILRDTTPFIDKRPSQPRYTDRARAIRRGNDDDKIAMLRKLYASHHALSRLEQMDMEQLEGMVVREIAIVLGDNPAGEVAALHALHAVEGAFRAKPAARKPDPPPPPLPRDPFRYTSHQYLGAFTVKSHRIVLGDPIYTHAWRDEESSEKVRYNALVPARDGKWHCYVELAEDPRDPVMSMLVVHDSIARKPDTARGAVTTQWSLWVDSGQMAALDETIRDDKAFDDAIHLGADVNGITAGRGCFHESGGGDGTYPLWIHAPDGNADLILVDFEGESRDFLIDARKRLLRR